jgi:TetR/AcrR family transcriptional repressor of nem operon
MIGIDDKRVRAVTTTVEKLLNEAESEIRLKGYHAVSFRDLAASLGIKSASVHYYFRQKEDLGLALVKRYSDVFFETLNARAVETDDKVAAFCAVYRDALVTADRICLCGMLGAESCGLPAALSDEVAAFFKANIAWVKDALPSSLSPAQRTAKAEAIVGSLQGAMMLAGSLKDHAVFDRTVKELQDHAA